MATLTSGPAIATSSSSLGFSGIRASRATTQPVRSRTGGSTFRNPPDMRAWELIEAAGCRGLRHGAAQVSEMHCNFLINTGGASAADIEALGEDVRRRVAAASGVELEWEIRRVGMPLAAPLRKRARVCAITHWKDWRCWTLKPWSRCRRARWAK